MPPYAYKICINYDKEKVVTEKRHELDSCALSIELLTPIVGDHTFSISDGDWGSCTICWSESRDETDEECSNRIASQEAYNKEVDRRRMEKAAAKATSVSTSTG